MSVLSGMLSLMKIATMNASPITNAKLEVAGRHPNEREDLQAFARFRVVVAYALLGDIDKARAARDDLFANHRGHVYEIVGSTFFGNYALHDIAAGCASVTRLAEKRDDVLAVLSDFGYANPDFKAEDVCPFR